MSHQDVAAVWSTLNCRVDIDNIVQELIGRYVLDVSEHAANRALFRATALSHVVALRTIFDLQRTYLQSPELTFESKASLLTPNILFSAIKHLLEVKILAFCVNDNLPDHNAHCSFIGQALVSGIRALHLHNRRLSSSEYDTIINKFKQAWTNETLLSSVDHFSINHFCCKMLAELSDNDYDHQLSNPACGVVRLQDFYHGLYRLDGSLNAFEHAAQTAIDTIKSSADWFSCALVLYDISWATIGAVIQVCMDNQYYHGGNHNGLAAKDAALLTLSPRFKMLEHIFRDSNPRLLTRELEWAYEQIQTMLCLSIRADCFGQECLCFGADSRFVQKMWEQNISEESSKNIARHFEETSPLDTEASLKELQSTLETRHTILPDVGKEFIAISQKIVEYANEWCTGVPDSLVLENRASTTPDDMFIVNCPELHPVPSKVLLPNIVGNSFMRPQQAILSSEDIQLLKNISVRTDCGQCSYRSNASNAISSARKVEPLSRTSIYIQEKLKERRKLLRSKVSSMDQASPQSARALLAPRHDFSVLPTNKRLQDQLVYALPRIVHTPQQIPENTLPSNDSESAIRVHRSSMSTVDMREADVITPPRTSFPAPSYIATASPSSNYSDLISRETSRTFNPTPFPTLDETTNLPEVFTPQKAKLPSPISSRTLVSDAGSSVFQSPSGRKWPFKSRRGIKKTSSTPSAIFFTSGKNLLLWNDKGACFYNLHNIASPSHQIITPGDILLAAGGTLKSAVICRIGPDIMLRIFQDGNQTPIIETGLEEHVFAMALSSNDHYLAMKFGNYVRVIDTISGVSWDHSLPSKDGRCGPKDHLVSFSTDCLSFAAATRFQPEKVITYFCECENPSRGGFVESNAPCGLVGDDGLSSLLVYSDKAAFLTTFTEKGYPTYLNLLGARSYSHVMRDKNQQIGSRIHSAALSATGQSLVLFNDRNEIFWIETPFGKEHAPTHLGNIKREKSVKREVELAMPNSDEVHVFWIHKGKGVLVTMGKGGGKSKPVELEIDLDRLLESE